MTKRNGLPDYHGALLEDLAATLDIEAGLSDAFQHLDHADLVDDVHGVLNIETGLASALNELHDEDEPTIEPKAPPIEESNVATETLPESDLPAPRRDSEREDHLGASVTEVFDDLLRLLHRVQVEAVMDYRSTSWTVRRTSKPRLNRTSYLHREVSQIVELQRHLEERSISREQALLIIHKLQLDGLQGHRASMRKPADRGKLDVLLDRLGAVVERLFDTSDEFGHVSSEL